MLPLSRLIARAIVHGQAVISGDAITVLVSRQVKVHVHGVPVIYTSRQVVLALAGTINARLTINLRLRVIVMAGRAGYIGDYVVNLSTP